MTDFYGGNAKNKDPAPPSSTGVYLKWITATLTFSFFLATKGRKKEGVLHENNALRLLLLLLLLLFTTEEALKFSQS
jgi:hypothetical protein